MKNTNDNAPEISLCKNFRNPFNSQKIINFSVSEQGSVSPKVFDLNENEFAPPVNKQNVKEAYPVNWNTAVLSGGIYF